MTPPEISIIIPTYNHLSDCLKPCIQSLMDHTDLTLCEVIIVANGCTDGTVEYVENLGMPFVLIQSKEALGYPAATNLGILAAKGQYVVLLNNDNVLLPQRRHAWIDALMAPFALDGPNRSAAKTAVVGPSKLYCHSSKYHFIIFFCAMVKRETFNELGLLDETFTPGGCEDIEFSIRCQLNGYSIAKTDADSELWSYGTTFPIYHKAEQTVHGVPDWEKSFARNNAILESRFRKPVKYSIIIDGTQTDDLQPCVQSVYNSTDYSECEIVLLVREGSKAAQYAQKVKPWGPYTVLETDGGFSSANQMIGDELVICQGEFGVVLDGRAILLGDKKWLSRLTKPFYRRSVDATSPMLINGHAARFLAAFRGTERYAVDYASRIAQARAEGLGQSFPIYFPHAVT